MEDLEKSPSLIGESTFSLFPELPIELKLRVWELAFPARVVNITYDPLEDRFHSFNSSLPLTLHIHKQSREMTLKTTKLCFGTETHEPRIYFDYSRDTLLFDDYLHDDAIASNQYDYSVPSGVTSGSPVHVEWGEIPLSEADEMNIQRVAVNATMFCYRSPVSNPKNFPDFPDHISGIERFRSKFLQREIRPLVVRFPALRQISIVIEEVNPFAKGDLVFFKIGPACLPVCEMCIKAASCAEPVAHLQRVYGKMLNISCVCAFRGSFIEDLGCYGVLIDKNTTEYIMNEKDEYNNLDPDFIVEAREEVTDGELEDDLFMDYEYGDLNIGFFDYKDPEAAAHIHPDEIEDLLDDERLYQELVADRPYHTCQDDWVPPDYYAKRMELVPLTGPPGVSRRPFQGDITHVGPDDMLNSAPG